MQPRNQYPRQLHSPEAPLHSEYEARGPYRDTSPPSQSLYQADTNPQRMRRTEDVEQPNRRLADQKMELQFQPERRGQTTAPNRWDDDEPSSPAQQQNARKLHVLQSAVSLDLLSKISRNIERFDPDNPTQSIEMYLEQLNYNLERLPTATDADKLYLLKNTSSSSIRALLDRQPAGERHSYDMACRTLKAWHSESKGSCCTTALHTKQKANENPKTFYERFRKAYFATENQPGGEESPMFKSVFINNLSQSIKPFMTTFANQETMTALQLRDMAYKSWANNNRSQDSNVHVVESDSHLQLEGRELQRPYESRPAYKQHTHQNGDNSRPQQYQNENRSHHNNYGYKQHSHQASDYSTRPTPYQNEHNNPGRHQDNYNKTNKPQEYQQKEKREEDIEIMKKSISDILRKLDEANKKDPSDPA